MSAAVSSLSIPDIEEALQIWGWGKWLMTSSGSPIPRGADANWIFRIKDARYRQTASNPWALVPECDPDYAMKLDGMIAKLPEVHKDILLDIYARHRTIREIERSMKLSKHTIAQHRDYAICYLYGQLKNS